MNTATAIATDTATAIAQGIEDMIDATAPKKAKRPAAKKAKAAPKPKPENIPALFLPLSCSMGSKSLKALTWPFLRLTQRPYLMPVRPSAARMLTCCHRI